MKKVFLLIFVLLVSCGDGGKAEIEAMRKAITDSIDNVNRQTFVEDSISQEIEKAKQQAAQQEREKIEKEQLQSQKEQQLEPSKKLTIDDLVGYWSVTMKCTNSTCERVALGDFKSETWQIYYESGTVFVKVYNNDNTTPKYQGSFNGKSLILSNKDKKNVAEVKLNVINSKKISGTRELLKSDPCRILYKVNLSR